MTPHPQPKTATRIARATLFLAIGGALLFLSMSGTAKPGDPAGDDAVIDVDFHEDDMGFDVTSSKGISNVQVQVCGPLVADENPHKHELSGNDLTYSHTEDLEIVGVWIKSGNNGIGGVGESFPNEGVDCSETTTSTSDTDTETSGSETGTETSGSETSTSTNPPDKHFFCHATGSDSNPYVMLNASVEGVFNGHLGDVDDHQDGEDIIPPFTFEGTVHSQNWDVEGQAIFDAGCEVPSDTDTETSGSDTDTETSGSDTDTETSGSETDTETDGSETDSETSGSDTQTETEEIPVFGTATTLALGVGGALGGALLMLRRKL